MANEDGALDQTMQLYGTFRIWSGIVIGVLVVLGAGVALVHSYTMDKGFVAVDGKIASVKCEAPETVSECSGGKNSQTCTTHKTRACALEVTDCAECKGGGKDDKGGDNNVHLQKTYNEGAVPKVGERITFYEDPATGDVRAAVLTDHQRTMMRVGAGVAVVVGVLAVTINLTFRKNKNFQRMQGGIGVLNSVAGEGGAFAL